MAGNIQKPLSIKLANFTSFNGKMSQWMTFHMEFMSAVHIYKMGNLIADNPNHNSMMTMDVTYKERCETLYNLLNKACTRGDAYAKIKKYESTYDVYKAWKELVKYYFTKGNIEAYAMNNISKLMNLSLEYKTPSGIEQYILKYQETINNLKEINQPMDDVLKKTFFLNSIKDPYYKPIKTLCDAESYSIDRCITEMCRVGLQQVENNKDKPRRHINNTKRNKVYPNIHNKNNMVNQYNAQFQKSNEDRKYNNAYIPRVQ